MKVLNLQCSHQHDFEGWFASEDDFHQQLERGLLSCPLCGDAQVRKMLSAPRLNLGRTSEEPVARAGSDEGLVELGRTAPGSELQGRLLRAVRELMSQTEDVGERFADQARAMHHGELAHCFRHQEKSVDEFAHESAETFRALLHRAELLHVRRRFLGSG